MNKTYKYTLSAGEKKEVTFDVGVNRLAISNANGYEGDVTIVTSEITKTKSGDIVSFDDGTDAPFADLKVNIEAVQSGSGDPSPLNVRNIYGFNDTNIYVTNKNLIRSGYDAFNVLKNAYGGNVITLDTTSKTALCDFAGSSSYLGVIQSNNEPNSSVNKARLNYYPFKENTSYTFIFKANTASTTGTLNIAVSFTDGTNTGSFNASNRNADGYIVYTSPNNKTVQSLYVGFYSGTSTFYYDTFGVYEGVVTYEQHIAQNGTKTNIDWQSVAGTVYGGQLNVKTGELTVTHDYIASYNGETINEPWISSMDVYSAGATPTTGAQVVYPLSTPVTYQLTPTEVRSLLGINNVWADCGSISLKYFVQSTQPLIDYIDEKPPVFFDAQEDFSTYDISLVGATSTDIKNYLLTHKNANIIIRVKKYSTIMLYYLREYSPNYFADFASHATIFDAEGTKSMRIDYLRLDLTQETADFTNDYIILPTT